MLSSHSKLIAAAAFAVLIVALSGTWLAALPLRLTQDLQQQLAKQRGLILDARQPQLDFANGLSLDLVDVSFTARGAERAVINAPKMTLHQGFGALLGWADADAALILHSPVIDIDVGRGAAASRIPATSIELRDATLRLRDSALKAVITLSDVNGTAQRGADDSLKLSLRFLLNDALTTLDADIGSLERFISAGSPADFNLAAKGKNLSFSGRAKVGREFSLDGEARMDADETGEFLSWVGLRTATLQQVGPLRVTAAFSSTGLQARLLRMEASLGAVSLNGGATLSAGPERPMLTAQLQTPQLSLWAKQTPRAIFATPWSERPLPVADLLAFDAEIGIRADTTRLHDVDLGAAEISFVNKQGRALMTSAGAFSAKFDVRTENARLTATAEVKTDDAVPLFKSLFGFNALAGTIGMTSNLSGEGNSLAALVSTLRGTLQVKAPSASIADVDAKLLLASPGEGWQSNESRTTQLTDMTLEAELTEGVATLRKSGMTFSGVTLKPLGEVDMLRQTFDLDLNPRGLGVDRKLRSLGTWTKPRFAIDPGAAPPLRPAAATTPPAN
jgi:AsmA-like C-terminal region